jgi:hypothetical protein
LPHYQLTNELRDPFFIACFLLVAEFPDLRIDCLLQVFHAVQKILVGADQL